MFGFNTQEKERITGEMAVKSIIIATVDTKGAETAERCRELTASQPHALLVSTPKIF